MDEARSSTVTPLAWPLLSIQVGRPVTYTDPTGPDASDGPWTSGIVKRPVAGPVRLGRLNLAGDGQADLRNHGGPDKAVNVYPAAHYPYWMTTLGLDAMPYGAFGENFTVGEAVEADVCLGDVLRVGSALVQVSQPRQPCWKLARRWGIPDLAAQVERTGRTGWYLRVLEEGVVEAGMALVLADRLHPEWPLTRVYAVARSRPVEPRLAAELAACAALSVSWRDGLRRVAAAGEDLDEA